MQRIGANNVKGVLFAVLAGLCWGISGCCSQFLFTYKGMVSTWLSPVRLLGSGITMLIVAFFTQRKSLVETAKCKKDMIRILCYGVFGVMMSQFSLMTAIQHTNAATATVIQYVGPVFVMMVVCLRDRRAPRLGEVIAVILAVGGTYLIATHGDPTYLAVSPEGLIWCLISALAIVTYTLIPGDVPQRRSGPVTIGYAMTVGGIVLSLVFGVWNVPPLDFEAILFILATIFIGAVGGHSFYLAAIRHIGPIKSSIISSVEPLSSAVISVLWLGNTFMAIDIIGFAMILLTVFLLGGKKKQEE